MPSIRTVCAVPFDAVERERHALRRIIGAAAELPAGRQNAGNQLQQPQVGPVRLGQFLHSFGSNLGVDVCALRLKLGSGCGSHLDSLGHSADLELGIDANHVVLVHQDVRGDEGAESRPGDLNPVRARCHRGDRVGARVVRQPRSANRSS